MIDPFKPGDMVFTGLPESAIVKRAPITDSAAIMAIIERAMETDFDLNRIEKLLELKERWDANEARKAFTVAMAAFKADPPKIFKDTHVRFKTQKGETEYTHASHAEVVEKIAAGLGKHGLSHRWDVSQEQNRITVTCIVTHALGHSERIVLSAPPDDSGTKNVIQAIGSTIHYLERYTILSITGLTSADLPDADNRKDEAPPLADDVRIALEDAANEGSDALALCFKGLAEETRGRIVADYRNWWTDLKGSAAAVKPQE
jgi:hypothetical protein